MVVIWDLCASVYSATKKRQRLDIEELHVGDDIQDIDLSKVEEMSFEDFIKGPLLEQTAGKNNDEDNKSNDDHNFVISENVNFPFKNKNFQHSAAFEAGKGRRLVFKNLKQILAYENQLKWPEAAVLYDELDAPISLRPKLEMSDLSGIPTSYRDPDSKLRYSDIKEYSRIKCMPSEIKTGYLSLHGYSDNNLK